MQSRYLVIGAVVLVGAGALLYRSLNRGSSSSTASKSAGSSGEAAAASRERPSLGIPGSDKRDDPGENPGKETASDPSPGASGPGTGPAPSAGAAGPAGANEPADREPMPPRPQLTPQEERAKKIVYLINARRTVKRLEKQGGSGGKYAETLAENRRSLDELEQWANGQSITEDELAKARAEIERERKRDEAAAQRRPR